MYGNILAQERMNDQNEVLCQQCVSQLSQPHEATQLYRLTTEISTTNLWMRMKKLNLKSIRAKNYYRCLIQCYTIWERFQTAFCHLFKNVFLFSMQMQLQNLPNHFRIPSKWSYSSHLLKMFSYRSVYLMSCSPRRHMHLDNTWKKINHGYDLMTD